MAALIQFLALMTILDSSLQYSAMSWTLTISIRINVHPQVGEIQKWLSSSGKKHDLQIDFHLSYLIVDHEKGSRLSLTVP